MANWRDLKAAVAEVIKTNGNNEITGQILQDTLNSIISNVGANATLVGVATPTTNPGAPDGNVFYFATQAGTYTNFGRVDLNEGLNILLWNGTSWAVTNVMNIAQELGTSQTAVMSQKATTEAINQVNANTGVDEYPTFSESKAYSAGDVVNYNGKLYQFTVAHAAGAWTGTDVEETKLTDLIISNSDNGGLLANAAHITGYIRLKAEDYYAFEKRFIRAADGTLTEEYDTNADARIIKIDVSAYPNGTIEYSKIWTGTNTRAALAFYSEDFKKLPTSKIFLKAIAQNSNDNKKRLTETIPENAKIALVQTSTNVENDDILLHISSEETSSLDERIEPLLTELEDDYIARDNNNLGKYDHIITSYERGAWLNDSGEIQRNNNPGYANRAIVKVPILDSYKGGRVGYYTTYYGIMDRYRLAFYDSEGSFLGGDTTNGSNMKYWEANIPDNAAYLIYQIKTDNYNDSDKKIEDYPITFFANEEALTVYSNSKKISYGYEDYPLPLGVMDNMLVDAISYNIVSSMEFISTPFVKDENGMLYRVSVNRKFRFNDDVSVPYTFVFRIKKSTNTNRVLTLYYANGTMADFNDNSHVGALYHQNITLIAYIIRQDKDYLWVYSNSNLVNMSFTITSYTNSSKNTYEKLELDMDRSFCIVGAYNVEDLDIDKKYYTRPEKLQSKLIGKKAIVFADSLSAFSNALVQDWGLSVYALAEGGKRMGYYDGNLDNWICRDDNVQKFKAYGLEKADYIIFAMGANDPTFEQSTEENVKFVLQNKRWFDIDAETDPFSSLDSGNKNKFSAAASLYAAAYSLCRLYPDAIISIVPPYRTPGTDVTEYDAEKYASVLFNGRFVNLTQQMREVATTMGAIFIENKTRNNAASADTYHGSDGVHPAEFEPYQDMASNIGHELSKYYDIAYNQE